MANALSYDRNIRHTQLLMGGASVQKSVTVHSFNVKAQLGHSSIATTVDLYGHLSPGTNRNVLDSLD